jgi:hypothetical protein
MDGNMYKSKTKIARALGFAATLALAFTGVAGSGSAWASNRPIPVGDVSTVRAPQSVFTEKDYFPYADRRLYKIEEPSLWKLSRDPNTRVFRFFFVPENSQALSIRIDFATPEEAILTWRKFSGRTADYWGEVLETKEIKLTSEQIKLFNYEFHRLNYWYLDRDLHLSEKEQILASLIVTEQDEKDESDLWLLEAAEYGKYHAVPRFNPTEGLVYEHQKFLVRFSGLPESLVTGGEKTAAVQ